MADSKHTPRPWDFKEAHFAGYDIETSAQPPRGVVYTQCAWTRSAANAAFIVKAVNNHATLLVASETALAYLQEIGVGHEGFPTMQGILSAAIAKAKGE